ncbi:MAG: transporter, family, cyanate transporter [Chloroflexota bacterium]|jgi:CP family cyanate transporter-like MFS transporter|nr:transporter, family, cyanate transporter [Chloroflexota bacterium]
MHGGLLVALFFAALALRPQLVGAGPLIPSIQEDLGLSHALAGLMGTIPVLCMGVFAPLAPIVAARVSTTVGMALSLAVIGGFGVLRALSVDGLQLALLTIGVGAGMGLGGALLPLFVKERMGGRPVAGTVAYSSGIQLGAALSAASAVPLALLLGGWRMALAVFSVATLALLLPWLRFARRGRGDSPAPRLALSLAMFRDRRGWLLAVIFGCFGMVYYGLVSWLAGSYVELGWTPEAAGGLVALLNVGSLAGALTAGLVGGRYLGLGRALVVLGIGFAVATAGFPLVPELGPVWAALAGYTNGALFPLLLALPLPLVGSVDRVAGISTVMLGAGYSLAATGPIILGAVRDSTGSFHQSLLFLVLVAAAFAASLPWVARWVRRTATNPVRL